MISIYRILRPYVRPYRAAIFAGLVAVVLSKLPQMALPKMLQLSVDHLRTGTTPPVIERVAAALGIALPGIRGLLLVYGALYLAIAFSYGVLLFASRWWMITASRRIELDFRNALFDKLTTLSARYFRRIRSGDIISRTTNDMDAVRMMVGPAVMYLATSVFTFGFAFVLMTSISWRLTLAGLLPIVVLVGLVKVFGDFIHDRYLVIQERLGNLSARIQENLSGIRVVKAYVQEPYETRRFDALNDEFVTVNERLVRVQAAFFPIMMLFAGTGILIALFLGGRMVIGGRITLGQLVQFIAYLEMLFWPTAMFGWVVNLFQRGTASLRRIHELLAEEPEIADTTETIPDARVTRGTIEIRDLSFSYDGTRPALGGISIRVPAGGTLGIVGQTGSGKSTLVSLVARIADPPPATVFVDGTDIRRIPLDRLRGAIGMVPQESFLFSDTVRENVRLGVPEASDDDVFRVADIASLREEVESFPAGWDTIVGERGITLSGGQKQRVAIARALLRESPLLILDDALSAVDAGTEARILAGLEDETNRRTTIVIAHRLSAVRRADHIVYLEEGRIVEEGTHADLVARGGKYAELHRRQQLEEELEAA